MQNEPPDKEPGTAGTPAGFCRDRLYAEARPSIADFRFDQSVVDVFPDMLNRSIPGYRSIIAQSGLLAARHAQPDTNLYDLGCSLGATSLSMRDALGRTAGCRIHAIDNSEAMVERCRTLLSNMPGGGATPVIVTCADLETIDMHAASVVAMNFTLQFVAPAQRALLMQRIFAALRPGGVLILSEKLAFDDPAEHTLHSDMYHAFKRANGYSDLEISQKRSALESVMIPDTLACHRSRLAEAGFARSSVWFQCFNFVSLIALRD